MRQETRDYLGTTKDGYEVYDRADSHIHTEGGIYRKLLEKALGLMYAHNVQFKKKEIKFPSAIGFNKCVSVTAEDDIVMVHRKGRAGQTPMVKGREAVPCNILTVVILKSGEKCYTLLSAYIGQDAPREPWDKSIRSEEERKKSEEFWKKHALIYDPKLID